MPWKFNSQTPVFLQIMQRIRADILNGTYPVDSQIPSVRQLAFDAAVNPNTMQRALTELENEGLLISRGTTGRFVTSEENVLNEARRAVREEALEQLLREARALRISDEEIISYIQKEGKNE